MTQLGAATPPTNYVNGSAMLRTFHNLQATPPGYAFTQLLGWPTIRRYKEFVRAHVPSDPTRRILEIGCGVGSGRPWFNGIYTGIDISPSYITKARQSFSGDFQVMDAAQMEFLPNEFDDAVSIATAHHLDDEQLAAMIRSSIAVASSLHLIDAILPISPGQWFKRRLFQMDRGRHVRTLEALREIVSRNARLEFSEVAEGPLHDVCYIRASRFNQLNSAANNELSGQTV